MTRRTYGRKLAIKNLKLSIRTACKSFHRKYIKNNLTEIIALSFILFCVFMFYGNVKFTLQGYRFGVADEEVHLFWIKSLFSGDPFPRGLYPHGMHFLASAIIAFLPISLTQGYLAMASVNTVLICFNLYLILRDLFKTKYLAMFGIAIYFIANIFQTSGGASYGRFQFALPMEFGLIAVFAAIYAMIEYMHDSNNLTFWFLALSITWSGYVHFYDTIWLVFMLIVIGVLFLKNIVKKKILTKTIFAGMLAALLIVMPFVIGLTIGFEFEQSMNWALDIIGGSAVLQEESVTADLTVGNATAEPDLSGVIDEFVSYLFSNETIAVIVILLNLGMFIYGCANFFVTKNRNKRHAMMAVFSAMWFVGAILYLSNYLGLLTLIRPVRAAIFLGAFTAPSLMFPLLVIEDVSAKLSEVKNEFSSILAFLIIIVMFASGNLRDDRYFYSSLTEEDAVFTEYIIESNERDMWTLITSTNSLTLVLDEGFHYEIITLLQEIERGDEIYIPTPTIYVTVEKEVKGWDFAIFTQTPEAVPADIWVSEEFAKDDSLFEVIYNDSSLSRIYVDYRPQLMSKLFYWAEKIQDVYPNESKIIMETKDAYLLKIEQDPYFLLNLSVDYMEALEMQ